MNSPVEKTEPVARLAPVQGYAAGIPWALHLRAYDAYCARYRPQPALITGGCRGGFSTGELDKLIPGWREETAQIAVLTSQLEALKAENSALLSRVERMEKALPESGESVEGGE